MLDFERFFSRHGAAFLVYRPNAEKILLYSFVNVYCRLHHAPIHDAFRWIRRHLPFFLLVMLTSFALRTRLILLSAVPLAMLLVLMGILAWSRWQRMAETSQLSTLSAIAQTSGEFIHELQLERAYSSRFLNAHGAQFGDELRRQRTKADIKLAAYTATRQSSVVESIEGMSESVKKTTDLLVQLREKRTNVDALAMTAAEEGDYYGNLIDEIIADVEFTAKAATYDAAIFRSTLSYITFIKLKERLGKERALLTGLFTRDTATKEEFIKATRIASEQFTLAALYRTMAAPEELVRFDGLVKSDLGVRIRTMRRALSERFPERGFGVQAEEWFDVTTQQINRAKEYETALAATMTTQNLALERQSRMILLILLATLAVILLGVFFLSARITHTIRQPIQDLTEGAERIESGNLTTPVPITSSDEIGRFAQTFNRMVENLKSERSALQAEKTSVEAKVREAVRTTEAQQKHLQTSVQEMLQTMEYFAKGDLAKPLPSGTQGDIGRLYDGYNQAIGNIRAMVGQVKMVIGAAANATGAITSDMNGVEGDISTQSEQITNIASAMEEMSATIAETTQQTTQASKAASEAEREAQSGGTVVSETLTAVRSIGEVVMHSVESIQALDRSSEQIGMVIQVIDEIADQTNLLALNAAIEAARAGDHGRGFAVVADEVRKLAERTQEATKEISSTIKQIQRETHSVVHEMRSGVQEVEKGNVAAAKAKEALERIISRSKEVSGIIGQVAVASEQQATSVELIASNVDSIARLTKHSQDAVRSTTDTTRNLGQLTGDLEYLIGQFRIDDGSGSEGGLYRIGENAQKQIALE